MPKTSITQNMHHEMNTDEATKQIIAEEIEKIQDTLLMSVSARLNKSRQKNPCVICYDNKNKCNFVIFEQFSPKCLPRVMYIYVNPELCNEQFLRDIDNQSWPHVRERLVSNNEEQLDVYLSILVRLLDYCTDDTFRESATNYIQFTIAHNMRTIYLILHGEFGGNIDATKLSRELLYLNGDNKVIGGWELVKKYNEANEDYEQITDEVHENLEDMSQTLIEKVNKALQKRSYALSKVREHIVSHIDERIFD